MRGARWNWPAFRCCAIVASSGSLCGLAATWRAHPSPAAASWWTYCDRCRPEGAEPIPLDVPYHVTRLTVSVAIASLLEGRQVAADEATHNVLAALDAAGAAVTRLELHGRRQGAERPAPSGFRLQLAGPAEPAAGECKTFWPEPTPARWRYRPKDGAAAAARRPQETRAMPRRRVGGSAKPARSTAAEQAEVLRRRGKAG